VGSENHAVGSRLVRGCRRLLSLGGLRLLEMSSPALQHHSDGGSRNNIRVLGPFEKGEGNIVHKVS